MQGITNFQHLFLYFCKFQSIKMHDFQLPENKNQKMYWWKSTDIAFENMYWD